MRGSDESRGSLFNYVDLESRVPRDHPLRVMRVIVNDVLASLSGEFEKLYSQMGRPSIPPEKLLRAPVPSACGRRLRVLRQLTWDQSRTSAAGQHAGMAVGT